MRTVLVYVDIFNLFGVDVAKNNFRETKIIFVIFS